MRLDKYLASVSELSRNDAKKAIRAGEVLLNGEVVTDPQAYCAGDEPLEWDERPLRKVGYRYFMLHKPEGYVSATRDKQHLTVMDLLDEDNPRKLHLAGRLDIDTTGLVLITDDGQWAHRITSPNHHCPKVYRVETADPIGADYVEKFAHGIFLVDDKIRCRPAELQPLDEQTALLTITEGKYHQVKRMFAALGNRVDALHRQSVGEIVLDEDLVPGEYRELTDDEIRSVR